MMRYGRYDLAEEIGCKKEKRICFMEEKDFHSSEKLFEKDCWTCMTGLYSKYTHDEKLLEKHEIWITRDLMKKSTLSTAVSAFQDSFYCISDILVSIEMTPYQKSVH